MPEADWKEVAVAKQAERASKIPKEWLIQPELMPSEETLDVQDFPHTSGLLTPEELEITESTASTVVAKIASGEWTSVQVLLATCKRAAIAQQLINCLTEIYFDKALSRAKELDEYFKKEGKVIGPLHGLPISFKDQFNLKGVDTSVGYIAWCNKPASEDSTIVHLLVKAGAVPFVKTNIPATLMMGESVNNVFGRTRNPRNRDLTTGGSSGGESALISFRGSFIGVGTDIGGSIRHPCSFTGLYGLRPSHGRVSYQKVANTFLGQEAVRSCAGPMCRSVDDIKLFMKSLAAQKPWLYDPQSVPLPWREELEVLPEKLCFGFGMGDGRVMPTPPLKRAMEMTKAALLAAGHGVIEFIPTEHIEAADIIYKMWSADGGEEFQRDTDASREPLHPQLESWLGHSANVKPMTVFETWQNQQRRATLQTKWLERWQATKELTGTGRPIDGLIMPSTPFPAIRHDGGYPHHWGALSPLLDLTTGVFPVTKVDLEKDVVPADWKPISELDEKVTKYYGNPKNHENALVGLAVIARRLEEEKVAAMMGEITKCLQAS
ncbi:related to Acetamidase [Phialocephala subalpina]|uniref:amidase n=1 Tax=Phialocephala subalpina TaxID=576137 RepID=A0A1L7XAX2_9HELO|nr:related to Acetamidase [Phialocephala subalpina]